MMRYWGFLLCCLSGFLAKVADKPNEAAVWLAAAMVIWCVNSDDNQKK